MKFIESMPSHEDPTKYRVCWEDKKTGATGCSPYTDKPTAEQALAQERNRHADLEYRLEQQSKESNAVRIVWTNEQTGETGTKEYTDRATAERDLDWLQTQKKGLTYRIEESND